MLQEAHNQKYKWDNLSNDFKAIGLNPIECKRILKILEEGVKFQDDEKFTNPAWINEISSQDIIIEPGIPPTHQQHIVLFSQLHYNRYIVNKIRNYFLDTKDFKHCLVKSILFWDTKQMQIRDYITTCNMGLVLNMAQNCKYTNLEYGELISEGSMALLRVTECYDYRLGFHFSTYACRAIGKSFARLAKKQYKLNRISYVHYDPGLELDTTCQQLRQQRIIDTIRQLRHYILGERGNLSEVEKQVLKMRFSVGESNGNQMTLKDIGSILGLSKERIRQIQNQAVSKLSNIVRD